LNRRLRFLSGMLDRLAEHVVIGRWGDLLFVSFGLFAALGAAVTIALTGGILIAQGLAPSRFVLLTLAGSAAVVSGSWLAAVGLEVGASNGNSSRALRRPAFVSWGGLIGLVVVAPAIGGAGEFSGLLVLDALARALPLGHAIGRIGCLSYGCCYGRATHRPLSIAYHNPDAKAVRVGGMQGVRIHPAPLYEAFADLVIFVVVNAVALHGGPVGMPCALTVLLYGMARFVVEFARDNRGRMIHGPLSINHAVAFAMACIGALMLPTAAAAAIAPPEALLAQALGALPVLLAVLMPASLVVFVGFATHRRSVGSW